MPTFDIVSEVDVHEVRNAMEQSNKEVGTRFDFKGIDASFALAKENEITLTAELYHTIPRVCSEISRKKVKTLNTQQTLKMLAAEKPPDSRLFACNTSCC